MATGYVSVTCPSCFQSFGVPVPPADELPAELDYDCEICCRPLVISIRADEYGIQAEARGIND